MGGPERLAKHRDEGQTRRPCACRTPARQGHILRVRHARRRRSRSRRNRRRLGLRQRPPGDGRRRGLHHPGRHDRAGQQFETLSARRTGAAQQDPADHGARGCRFPSGRPLRANPDRSTRASEVLRSGPDSRRGARAVGRTWRPRRAGVRLQDHEPPGCDLHRRAAGGERVDGRGHLEGGSRRAGGRGAQRGDPQRRRRRRGRARRHPPIPVVLPVERVVLPVAHCRRNETNRPARHTGIARHRLP